MKSPTIRTLLFVYSLATVCYGEEKSLLWTQTSAIWSSIRGVKADLQSYSNNPTTNSNYVRLVGMSKKNVEKVGLAYDQFMDELCWNDFSSGTTSRIYCQPRILAFNETEVSLRTVLTGSFEIRDIALDYRTGNIYFATPNLIAVAPSRGGKVNIYKHILSEGLTSVSGLALAVEQDKLLWTDSARGTVHMSSLAGTNRVQLMSSESAEPIGISVVPDQQMVFWADRKLGTITGCSYASAPCYPKMYSKRRTSTSSLFGIAVYSNLAFVTDVSQLTLDIYEVKNDSFNLKSFRELDAKPYHVIVADGWKVTTDHDCKRMNCSHICLNMGDNKGQCACSFGEYLDEDGVSCSSRPPRYVYTTGKAVVLATISIDTNEPMKLSLNEVNLVNDQDNARPLGYHYRESRLFFGDQNSGVLSRGNMTSTTPSFVEHTVNTKKLQGIAVDWLSSNVYWTDQELSQIMVSKTDGRYHKVLVSNAGNPTGITVDSKHRFIFWNDATSNSKKIWRVNLMGLQSYTIDIDKFSNFPQGIFTDPHKQRLYWVDKTPGKIESMDYDGYNRITFLEHNTEFYDIAVFQDLTTWTDLQLGIQFRRTLSKEMYALSPHPAQRETNRAYDVIAYDPYLQPNENHACLSNNGGCDQLCFLTSSGKAVCACAIGFTLNNNNKSCDSDFFQSNFVMYTDPYHKQVYQSSLNEVSPRTNGIPGYHMNHPISVDYDTGKNRIFWIDQSDKAFWRANVNGGPMEKIREISSGSWPQRLVVDPVNGWIYYTDKARGTVSKMMVDGSTHSDLYTGLNQPYAIDLDYTDRTLVWSSAKNVMIGQTDGTGIRTIGPDLVQGGGVTISHDDHIVYFSDNSTGKIYSYNLTDSRLELLYEKAQYRIHALAVSQDHVYFSTYNEKALYRINLTDKSDASVVDASVFARLTDVKVVGPSVRPVYTEGGVVNWIIPVGVIAGALLLLLLLLAAILGTRNKRLKAAQAQGNGHADAEGLHISNDVDQAYTYVNQSHIFDIRGRNEALNGNGVNGQANGQNVVATGFDAVSENTLGDYAGYNELETMSCSPSLSQDVTRNGHPDATGNGHPDVTLTTAPVLLAVPPPAKKEYTQEEVEEINRKYKPKRTHARKKTIHKDPEFEFAGGDKVATRIQRLVHRMRNGLSSVRWSSGDKNEGESTQPDDTTGPDPEIIDPKRTNPHPKAAIVKGPPVLHQMPRGFAPASHCVPAVVKK